MSNEEWAAKVTVSCGWLFCQATVHNLAKVIGQARVAERERCIEKIQERRKQIPAHWERWQALCDDLATIIRDLEN